MGQSALPANALSSPHQTGRSLIGWMTADEATLCLSGRRADLQNLPEYGQRAEQARASVAAREAGLDQANIQAAPPPELDAHIEALHQSAAAAQMFNEGWQVCPLDLPRVCAAQPTIITGSSTQRAEGLVANDLAALAAVSLPISVPATFPAAFDPTKNTWVFSSANPNLRIQGAFNGQAQPGQNVFGFVVGISTSFLSAAVYQNRYLLRDGYHRAFAFLSRGITRVPAFVRTFGSYQELGLPAGMLPQEAFLGARPPVLRDYLSQDVSADVEIPVTQKIVLVQAQEFSTLS
jgi:hypothetical protein